MRAGRCPLRPDSQPTTAAHLGRPPREWPWAGILQAKRRAGLLGSQNRANGPTGWESRLACRPARRYGKRELSAHRAQNALCPIPLAAPQRWKAEPAPQRFAPNPAACRPSRDAPAAPILAACLIPTPKQPSPRW